MANEPIRIIGNRIGQTSVYDVVVIHSTKVRFIYSNPLLAIPIPSTGNVTVPTTKLINLKRILFKVVIDGFIVDTTPTYSANNLHLNTQLCHDTKYCDGSARAIGFTASSGAINYDGASCVAVTKAIEKKWILQMFAFAGANAAIGATGLTVQWRDIVNPAGSEYLANPFTKAVNPYIGQTFISELTITDDAAYPSLRDSASPPFHYIEMMPVQITLMVGDPST